MSRGSFEFIQEVSGLYTSPFTDELKMAFRARKVSGALEKRAPELWEVLPTCIDLSNLKDRI